MVSVVEWTCGEFVSTISCVLRAWLFKVHPKFLSSVSTCCLYIAAKASEPPVLTASLHNLLVLGQCGGSLADLIYTERLIVELLGAEVMQAASACNPLAFLRMFHNILLVDFADSGTVPALDLSLLVSKLEVIVSQFDFTRYHVSRTAKPLLHLFTTHLITSAEQQHPMILFQCLVLFYHLLLFYHTVYFCVLLVGVSSKCLGLVIFWCCTSS